jgi:chemotaxis signal transduction protein
MYAIRTDALERVFAIQHLTPLARAPRFVRGVLSLDGRIVAAIDIRRLCGRDGEAGATRQYGALIAGAGSECVVLVDAVMGLRSFADADIHAAAEGESKHRAGVTRDGVAVLDVGWLLRTCVQLAA